MADKPDKPVQLSPVEKRVRDRQVAAIERRAGNTGDLEIARHLYAKASELRDAGRTDDAISERRRLRDKLGTLDPIDDKDIYQSTQAKLRELEAEFVPDWLDVVDRLVTGLLCDPLYPHYSDATAVAAEINAKRDAIRAKGGVA